MSAATNSTQLYSKIAENNFQFRRKNQAIVIDAVNGIKVNKYLEAIAILVGPLNIIAAALRKAAFVVILIVILLLMKSPKKARTFLKLVVSKFLCGLTSPNSSELSS